MITLNVNGLGTKKRRLKFFCWFRKLKFDILFIQETHCYDKITASEWSQDWGPKENSIWTTGSSNSKGVAVLFKPHSIFDYSNLKVDNHGRYIYFELKLEDENFKFINIYAPNDPNERVLFFKKLKTWIDINDKKNVIGGDYNCTIDAKLDRMNCLTEYDKGRDELNDIMKTKFLIDIYRTRNPGKKCFSFTRGDKHSRLDYWLIDRSLDGNVDKIDYQACPFSDHNMAVLKLDLSKIEMGPGIWKMNSNVIKTELFKNCFYNMWENWQKEKTNYHLHEWWDLGKKKIKKLTVWCAQKLKDDREVRRNNLQNCLNKEINLIPRNEIQIHFLEESIEKIISEECEGGKIRSRSKWFEEGEKPTAYFHNLEKYNAQKKNWTKILDENNQLVYGTDEIIRVQTEFYKKLFKTEGSNLEQRQFFGNFLKNPIGPENFAILNKKIDLDDIFSALKKIKKNSSPGPDGITYEFYLEFFDVLKDDLLQVYTTSYAEKELAYSQYLALIILLYKKDVREDIKNWRPISLSNTDIKILSKIMAERLKKVLPYIIHVNQCGCVKGRKIGQGIRFVEDTLESMDDENIILIDDNQKAFDRVEWQWLFYALEKFGLGSYFIGWIKILYKNMKSAIMTNGYVSKYFDLSRGIRQGDPLSALLYVIQSEALSEALRCDCDVKGIYVQDSENNYHEVKGSQYVDDANNMLFNIDYIHRCLGLIDNFGEASGSRLNKSKSLALVSEHFADDKSLEKLVKISRNVEIVLGVPIGRGQDKSFFWNKKFEKMEQRILLWKTRNLSMFGKVHLSKSLVLPLIQYAASHIDVENDFIRKTQDLIWSFIWKWKTCFVAKPILFLPRGNGGLGVPNVDLMIKAARIRMIINVMSCTEQWNILARKYLCCLDQLYDIKDFAMLVTNSTNELEKIQIPAFYRKCLFAFQELNGCALVSEQNNILWCNKDICIKGKVFEHKHWSRNGIKFVSDVVKDNKLNVETVNDRLHQKSGCARYMFEYATLVKNIPDQIVKSCKNCNYPTFENLKYVIPGKEKPVGVFQLETRDIYLALVWGGIHKRKSESYWQNKFNDVEIDFNMLYKCLFVSKIMPRIALDFNFRIFNGQVLMEKYLVKMKLSNGKCKCCDMNDADVMHLFNFCPYFENVWNSIINILSEIGYTKVEAFNRIFGYLSFNRKHDVANMILSWARWIVWKRHCDIKHGNDLGIKCVKDQFNLTMKEHFNILLSSKNLLDVHSRKLCETVLPLL